MANVYRQGRKDVHRRRVLDGEDWDIFGCALDPGGDWSPVEPPGSRCPKCFRGHPRRGSRGRTKATLAGTAAALALATAVVASSLGEPVNLLPIPTSAGPAFSALPLVTPGPSRVPPTPSAAPALTPAPIPTAAPTVAPLPTFGPLPTYPPVPTFPPLPTWPPFPIPSLITLPDPTPLPKVCIHPGLHVGVLDPCKWPQNR